MMDDAELLRDYAENRSETAFAGFVERRVGFVYATALRMVAGNAHTAQDVTQTVFTLAARKAAALAKHERLAGWLHTTTCNVSRQTLRETRRRATREQEAARMNEIENENHDADGITATERRFATAGRGEASQNKPDNPNTPENTGVGALRASGGCNPPLRSLLDEALGALRESEREAVLLRYFEGMAFAGIGVKFKMSEEAARKRVARAVEKMRALLAKRGVTSSASALGALMTAEAAQAAPAGLAASVSAGVLAAGVTAAAGAAATTATITSAILAFMSSTKITTVAVVALLIAAGGAYYGAQSERATSAALARARQENVRLSAQLREAEKQSAAASAAATKAAVEAATQAYLTDHPEVKETTAAWAKSRTVGRLFRVSHDMNLSPEQSARLVDILCSGGVSFGSDIPGYGEVRLDLDFRQSSSQRRQELLDLLGEEGIEKFRELNALDDAGEGFIRGLGNALYFTATPLTSRQARSLEKIATDLTQNHADITDPEARWNALVEQARSVLSPEQMRALVAAGDRYVWKQTSEKWYKEYDDARVVETATAP